MGRRAAVPSLSPGGGPQHPHQPSLTSAAASNPGFLRIPRGFFLTLHSENTGRFQSAETPEKQEEAETPQREGRRQHAQTQAGPQPHARDARRQGLPPGRLPAPRRGGREGGRDGSREGPRRARRRLRRSRGRIPSRGRPAAPTILDSRPAATLAPTHDPARGSGGARADASRLHPTRGHGPAHTARIGPLSATPQTPGPRPSWDRSHSPEGRERPAGGAPQLPGAARGPPPPRLPSRSRPPSPRGTSAAPGPRRP